MRDLRVVENLLCETGASLENRQVNYPTEEGDEFLAED